MERRQRRPRTEARQEILDVAETLLREDGPAAVTLSGVARKVGVSHQAVSYHFHNRQELLATTAMRTMDGVFAELLEKARDPGADLRTLFGFEDRGAASTRAFASLVLSGDLRDDDFDARMTPLLEAAERIADGSDRDDLISMVEVAVFLSLGRAVFGDRMRRALGIDPTHRDPMDWLLEKTSASTDLPL